MPLFSDFNIAEYSDGTITIPMSPPVNVGGMSVLFTVARRFLSDAPIALRSAATGFGGGQSGVTVLNSGEGVFKVTLPTPEEMSGRDPGNYACQLECIDSGRRGPLWQGYMVVGPNVRR